MRRDRIILVLIGLLMAIAGACFGYYFAVTQPMDFPQTTTAAPATTTQAAPVITTVPTLPTTAAPTQPTTAPTQSTTAPTQSTTAPTQPTTVPTEPATEPTQPAVEVALNAKQAFVYDLSKERYLYVHGDLDQQVEPASITKLFSAYVALQYLSADTIMTAGEEVSWIDPDSSRAYIYKGHKVSVEMCVQGMIIPSGNDAAYVLAVNAGRVISGDANISARGAYDAFVAEMNRQAQELGLTGTHFVNPDGMNEKNHYTTMRDLVAIAKLALDNPIIAEAAAIQKMTAIFPSGHFAEWTNSNVLLDKNSSYYCANAIGLKTGSTSTAGKCLISAFQKDGKVYLICVMGCSTNNSRYDDTLALYKAVCCN